jgi:two-component system, OmpR family, aerobic respiration control sensor histidine kinase ArcB
MNEENKTREQLIDELKSLRQRVSELESSESLHKQEGEILHIFRMDSPVGLYIVQDHKFVFVNKQFREVTDINANERVLLRVLPEDRETVRENAIKMLKGERLTPYQYRVKRNDGKIRWMREGVVSVQYQGKRATLGHSMDITDRIDAEAKLRELYENEKKLRQELEEEVRKRIEFTRALVHELKTPLTPVLFSSELLVSEIKEEPYLSIARNINRGANNLNRRIDELLDLARVEIGSLQINPKLVDSRQLLNNIADYVTSLIAKNQQHLTREIDPNLPQVWADEDRLQQIVLNLLINASKFTQGGGTITLASRQKDHSLLVEVKDTGPGIPKAEQERIFEPYQRRRTDIERLSGLGLGLSLCKNLVELHGGKIWLESEPGKGSTFAFTIPLKPPAQTQEKSPEESASEVINH